MPRARVWSLLALCLLLAGCLPAIYSQEPLGERRALDPVMWEGTWLGPSGLEPRILMIRVVDAERGIIGLRHGCREEGRRLPDLQVRVSPGALPLGNSGATWLFMIEGALDAKGEFVPKDGLPFQYTALAARPGRDLWTWYFVADDRFESLVRQGALPGRIEDGRLILGHLDPEHYQALASVERPVVHWEDPTVFLRLPPELDPCKKEDRAQ